MEKIVIVAKETANYYGLIELLKVLFPECEICTVSPDKESPEACPKDFLS